MTQQAKCVFICVLVPTTSGNWGDYVVESCNGVNYTKRTCGDFEGDGCDGDAFFCKFTGRSKWKLVEQLQANATFMENSVW